MSRCIWITLLSLAAICAQCIEVHGDRVRAKDVAGALGVFAMLPPEKEITISPMPGVTRTMTAAQLSLAIGAPLSEEICVHRATRPLTVDQILHAMHKSLSDDQVRLSVLDFSRADVPEGQVDFPRSGLVLPHVGVNAPVMWRGKVQYGGGRSVAVWAKVRVSKPARVLVVRRAMASAEVLSPADIEEREIDYFPMQPPIVDAEKIMGLETARRIPAETILQPWMLRTKRAISKGDIVQVSVIAPGAQLRFETKAEFEGRAGESILVRNPLNGKLVAVIVRGEGIAEIDVDRKTYVKKAVVSSRVGPDVDERNWYGEAKGLSTDSR